MILVDNIMAYCKSNDMTIAGFERKCGISNGIVRQWKNGRNRTANIATLSRIAEATGVEMTRWLKEGGVDGRGKADKKVDAGTGKKAKRRV